MSSSQRVKRHIKLETLSKVARTRSTTYECIGQYHHGSLLQPRLTATDNAAGVTYFIVSSAFPCNVEVEVRKARSSFTQKARRYSYLFVLDRKHEWKRISILGKIMSWFSNMLSQKLTILFNLTMYFLKHSPSAFLFPSHDWYSSIVVLPISIFSQKNSNTHIVWSGSDSISYFRLNSSFSSLIFYVTVKAPFDKKSFG